MRELESPTTSSFMQTGSAAGAGAVVGILADTVRIGIVHPDSYETRMTPATLPAADQTIQPVVVHEPYSPNPGPELVIALGFMAASSVLGIGAQYLTRHIRSARRHDSK